jgi:hypothetical protein
MIGDDSSDERLIQKNSEKELKKLLGDPSIRSLGDLK